MTQENKFLKISPLEAGGFTATKNLVTFELPRDTTLDLNDSYLSFFIQPNFVPFEPSAGDPILGVLPYLITHSAMGAPLAQMTGINGLLIKNSRIYSDTVGSLEDIRGCNRIFNYLSYFTNSIDAQTSTGYYSVLSPQSDLNIFDRFHSTLEKVGDVFTDLNTPFEWVVPLREFLNLGKMNSFNTTGMGNVRIQVELDISSIGAAAYCADNSPLENLHFGSIANRQVLDISGPVAQVNSFITQERLGLDLARSPFFVGQVIHVFHAENSTSADPPSFPANLSQNGVTITEIEVIEDENDVNLGRLILSLSSSLGTLLAGQLYINIAIGGNFPPAGYTNANNFDFQSAELRVKEIPNVVMNELTYITIINETDNGNGLTQFNKQFLLQPECIGFIIIQIGVATPFVPDIGDLSSYRLSIDQLDVVGNRDIPTDINNGLQYEVMNKLFLNLGLPLNKTILGNAVLDDIFATQTQTQGDGKGTMMFIGSPTSMTDDNKILNISLNARTDGATIKQVDIYKFLVKKLTF